MIRALLDTNILLDVLLKREPFVKDAAALWQANEQGLFEGSISAITPVNVFYIARKIKDNATARKIVEELLVVFRVVPIDHLTLQSALALPLKDYEDSVQLASAVAGQLDAIVTRDIYDYAASTIPVFSPADFLSQLSAQ